MDILRLFADSTVPLRKLAQSRCPRLGTLFDTGLDPFDAAAPGLALAVALALEECDSEREQLVRAITSAGMVRTKRTPGRIEQ